MVVTQIEMDFAEEVIHKFKEDNLGVDVVSQLYAMGTLIHELTPTRTIELMVKVLEAENCEDEDVFSTLDALSSVLAIKNAEDFAGVTEPGEVIETAPAKAEEVVEPYSWIPCKRKAPAWAHTVSTTLSAIALVCVSAAIGFKVGQYIADSAETSTSV